MKKLIVSLLTCAAAVATAKPQTLLEMASSQIPFDKEDAALVLIDYQNEYVSGKLPLYDIQNVIKESAQLLEWARHKGMPVIHVLHQGKPGGVFDVTAFAGKEIAALAPRKGETVIYKSYPNAFNQTQLEKVLRAQKKSSVLFAGLMTHMCVEASVRAAFDLGFHAAVIANTTTTRDLPGAEGETVPASALQRASLAAIKDLVALVVPTLADL